MIDILIPVLGRPHNAGPIVKNINETTSTANRVIFLCSRGDHEQRAACVASGADQTHVMEFPPGRGDYARKINYGFNVSDSEWVFAGADDIRFEAGWDTIALKVAGDNHHVVATNDMANAHVKRGMFGTHNLIRRRYITDLGGTGDEQPGVLLWEGYDHNFPDRELCHLAEHRGVYAFARHSRVRHFHPLWKTAPQDATYHKALRHFREDQQLFLARAHLWGYTGLSAHERKLAA